MNEETQMKSPVYSRDVFPQKFTGPNLFGQTVTCWGMMGKDENRREMPDFYRRVFVYLDSPEQASKYYETDVI